MTSLCIKCGGDSQVKDSRPRPNGVIIRRRECMTCKARWTTEEVTVGSRANTNRTRAEIKRLRYAAGVFQRFFDNHLSEVK